MKKTFLFALLLAGTICFGQTNCNIKKAYAYYTVSVPGVQMADENGNPVPPKPYIARFIYIECNGSKIPGIKTVLYNKFPLSFSVMRVKEKTVSVGNKPNGYQVENNRVYTITAKRGNTLWKIDLEPVAGKPMVETDCKNIIIKTKDSDKVCKFKLQKETQLMTLPRY